MKIFKNILQFLFVVIAFSATSAFAIDLSNADKDAIAKIAGLIKEGNQFYDTGCDKEEIAELVGEDLNQDGQAEVFVRKTGMCWGGAAGVAISLYIKNPSGKWIGNLGFPGNYKILETKNFGYADLEITGPGFCFPVWRWNGTVYELFKKCPL